MSVSRHARLTAAASSGAGAGDRTTLVPVERIVERARARKDAYELAVLGEAARRLSLAADRAFAEVRPGRTERQVALAIDARSARKGSTSRRLIRLWPAVPSPPCRMRDLPSEN